METKVINASAKIMLSYDYCHFEISAGIENEEGLSLKEIDNLRKNVQRLADKAVTQYKKAKEMAAKRMDGEREMRNFEEECQRILKKNEADRTLKEIAMLKEYQDERWQEKFLYLYDYEDECEDEEGNVKN